VEMEVVDFMMRRFLWGMKGYWICMFLISPFYYCSRVRVLCQISYSGLWYLTGVGLVILVLVADEIEGSIVDYSGLTPAKRPSDGPDGDAKRARYSSLGTDDEIQRNVREDHLAGRLLSSDLGNDTGTSSLPRTR